MTEKLSVKRRQQKKRTPQFRRHEAGMMAKLSLAWRKPKGRHNKMRVRNRGKPYSVSVGYKSPEDIRGLTRSGKERVRVFTVAELTGLDKERHQVIIGSTVGRKKKLEILKAAEDLQLPVANRSL